LDRDLNSPKSRRAGFLPFKPWRNPLAAQEPYRSILRLSPFGCICVKFLTSLFQSFTEFGEYYWRQKSPPHWNGEVCILESKDEDPIRTNQILKED